LKVFVLILLAISAIFASNVEKLEAQLLSTIAHGLVHKREINVCVDDPSLKGVGKYFKNINIVSCGKADLVFTSHDKDIMQKCKTNLVFSTSYYLYEHSPMIVGAFFWQKGRPNIVFREKRLSHLGISLPKNLRQYAD